MTRAQYIKAAASALYRARDDGRGREICLDRAARYLRAAGLDTSALAVNGPCDTPTDTELEELEETLRSMLFEPVAERRAA